MCVDHHIPVFHIRSFFSTRPVPFIGAWCAHFMGMYINTRCVGKSIRGKHVTSFTQLLKCVYTLTKDTLISLLSLSLACTLFSLIWIFLDIFGYDIIMLILYFFSYLDIFGNFWLLYFSEEVFKKYPKYIITCAILPYFNVVWTGYMKKMHSHRCVLQM